MVKKAGFLVLSSILLLTLLTGSHPQRDAYPLPVLPKGENLYSDIVIWPPEDVFLTMAENSLTPGGADFYLKNDGDKTYIYGDFYLIQVKLDGEWFTLDDGADAYTLVGYSLAPGEEVLLQKTWGDYYGQLPPGEYRFVLDIGQSAADAWQPGIEKIGPLPPPPTFYMACAFSIF